MHHEKEMKVSFPHKGDAGLHRTHTVHGMDHVKDGQHNGAKMHDSLKHGTPFRTVHAKHEEIHGAHGMESSGKLHASHHSAGAGAFGKKSGHAEMKSDLHKGQFRPSM